MTIKEIWTEKLSSEKVKIWDSYFLLNDLCANWADAPSHTEFEMYPGFFVKPNFTWEARGEFRLNILCEGFQKWLNLASLKLK